MPSNPIVDVFADVDALAAAAATYFADRAQEAIAARGRFMVALAGGTTLRALYSLLATERRDAVQWPAVHVFWSDERHVPPTRPESNFGAAQDVMLSRVPVPAAQVHRIRAERPDAATVAARYERTLRREFSLAADAWPVFDLVLLGMGPDGHTASLFPGSDALTCTDRLVLAPWVEIHQAHRLTLSLPVLNHAAHVAFLVSGKAKAAVLRDVLEGPEPPDVLPARAVRPADGRVSWFVDRAAAACLGGSLSGI